MLIKLLLVVGVVGVVGVVVLLLKKHFKPFFHAISLT